MTSLLSFKCLQRSCYRLRDFEKYTHLHLILVILLCQFNVKSTDKISKAYKNEVVSSQCILTMFYYRLKELKKSTAQMENFLTEQLLAAHSKNVRSMDKTQKESPCNKKTQNKSCLLVCHKLCSYRGVRNLQSFF